MARTKTNVLKLVVDHPDQSELISKMCLGISEIDISNWLSEKYSEVQDQKLTISAKHLKEFKDEYLDIYSKIREDAFLLKNGGNIQKTNNEMQEIVETNPAYREMLEQYVDKEVDIRTMVKRMILAIEKRSEDIFNMIQSDTSDVRKDKILIEWLNLLVTALEKYEPIINGTTGNVVQQNQINIQIMDQHLNMVYEIIKEVLAKLDYDTSLFFIERFNEEMKKIKSSQDIIPIDSRIEAATELSQNIISSIK